MADRTERSSDMPAHGPSRRRLVQGFGVLAGATVLAGPVIGADAVGAQASPATSPPIPPMRDAALQDAPDDPFVVTPGLTYLNVSAYDFKPITGVPYVVSVTGSYVPDTEVQFTAGLQIPSGAVIKELSIGARNSGIATQTYELLRVPYDGTIASIVASAPLIPGNTAVRLISATTNHVVDGNAAYLVLARTVSTNMVRIFSARVGYTAPVVSGTFISLPVPIRIYDSRPGTLPASGLKTKFANHEERVLDAKLGTGVPAGASSVLVNVAATNTNPGGFFSLFKNGVAWPNTSTLNWGVVNTTVSTLSATQLAANGTFKARCEAPGGADLVADVVGWFT